MALTQRKSVKYYRDQMGEDVLDRDPDSAPRNRRRIAMTESDEDDLSDSLSDTGSSSSDYTDTDTSDVSEPLDRTADELGGPDARKTADDGRDVRKTDDTRDDDDDTDSGDCSPRRDFSSLLSTITQDDVLAVVKSDACLTEYGEHLYRLGHHGSRLRNKMRELARLLISSRKSGPLKTMRDHVAAANFMHVVRAVKRASGFDGDAYERPSLALGLGRDLKAVSRLAESGARQRGDRGAAWDARHFRAAYKASWSQLLTDS